MSSSTAFWTSPLDHGFEPKFQYRFRVTIGALSSETNSYIWWAKSVDRPGLTFAKDGDGKFAFGSDNPVINTRIDKTTFKPVKMVLIDPSSPDAASGLVGILKNAGYGAPDAGANLPTPYRFKQAIGRIMVEQLNQNGKPIEQFELKNAMIYEIDFGSLDYSNDNPVEITISLIYEAIKITSFDENGAVTTEFDTGPTRTNDNAPAQATVGTPGPLKECEREWKRFINTPGNVQFTYDEWRKQNKQLDGC